MAKAAAQQVPNHPIVPDRLHESRLPIVKIPAMSVEHLRMLDTIYGVLNSWSQFHVITHLL